MQVNIAMAFLSIMVELLLTFVLIHLDLAYMGKFSPDPCFGIVQLALHS